MLDTAFLAQKFAAALPYDQYLATGNAGQQQGWQRVYDSATLTDAQVQLVRGFTREMRVLVSSGIWCGDCVQQCPLLQRIAEANPQRVLLRFVDRDQHADLAAQLRLNGGGRVPVVVFMAEDHEFAGLFGDRTLSRYRAIAGRQLGPSCPLPGAPVDADEQSATLAEWLDEFERIQLLLRTSPRLRQKHGD